MNIKEWVKTPDLQGVDRIVSWFSYGVISAVASKIAHQYAVENNVKFELVVCDTGSEHKDNYRFGDDVSEWIGVPLTVLRSETYSNTNEVYLANKMIKVKRYAICSYELNKLLDNAIKT